MALLTVTQEFMELVEKETGYPARLLEDPGLPVFAKVQMARGNVPAHFVHYKPTRDASLDYMICHQCGFVLRLFASPPDQRYSLGGTAEREREVLRLVSPPGGTLARLGLPSEQLAQMASTFYSGLMTHLLSIPVGMRIADWVLATYAALHESQRATVLKELADARASLQPQIRAITPERVLTPTMAINAAHAMFWADRYGMRELSGPYRSGPYEAGGAALWKIWQEMPRDPRHDRDLIDRWGESLGLTEWYRWVPYETPEWEQRRGQP